MSDYPILFFYGNVDADKTKRSSRPPMDKDGIHRPNVNRKSERFSPIFRELSQALERKTIQVQQSTAGVIPEEVLVLETIGSVANFVNTTKRIQGLELFNEFEETIEPDEDYYIDGDGDKSLSGCLYLMSTNSTALQQLLRLWERYIEYPEEKFERGYKPLKDVFENLKCIRKWDVQDRFKESSILQDWEFRLQNEHNRTVRLEIELWYRKDSDKRQVGASQIRNLIENSQGRVINETVIEEISYHAILAELPIYIVQEIVENKDSLDSIENIDLIKCDDIMFFKPIGQSIYEGISNEEEIPQVDEADVSNNEPLPIGDPIVAIFDGYPIEHHTILENRLNIDDPDEYSEDYAVAYRKHGTAMCSLVLKGDIKDNNPYISSPLYVRPMMRPNSSCNYIEQVPNDILWVDLVHRAVKRMFEGENGEPPVAPTVKIINLSMGDPDRLFYNTMSPLSRLLDWLSFKYKVLFIVSGGNHNENIDLSSVLEENFSSLSEVEQEKVILHYLKDNSRKYRLMSPAESINSITVGAIYKDCSAPVENSYRLKLLHESLPSAYTSIGGGYKKAIKPDIVYDGGVQMYSPHPANSKLLRPCTPGSVPPGHYVAAPGDSLSSKTYCIGTSDAAALVTYNTCKCYEAVKEIVEDEGMDDEYISLLLKAMLVHGCTWGEIGENIDKRLSDINYTDRKKIKESWLGNGYPDFHKVIEGTKQRAVIIGYGELFEEKAHIYSLPIPLSLSTNPVKRRLTITLSWLSPINANTQRYRGVKMWFEPPKDKPLVTTRRMEVDNHASKRGTVQHEVYEGRTAETFIDGDFVKIKVNCAKDASDYLGPIPYVIMVTLEVAENLDLPIYEEIKNRLPLQVPIMTHA